ncbi:MAG: hypothetical protein AAF495_15860 [Pseudomonadota bacterium]
MSTDFSKLCADFLRESHRMASGEKLKASHARELVAAFFGYKSHAALLAESRYPVSRLEETNILVPNVPLMDGRRRRLTGLPASVRSSYELASNLCTFLQDEDHFTGQVWLYESLENYILEVFLPEHDYLVSDELSGVMAETNAYFDESLYESASVSEGDDDVVIEVEGVYNGTNDPDKPFSGNKIDVSVTVTLYRMAGRTGFLDFEVSAGGAVSQDWVDWEDVHGAPASPN